MSFETLAQVVAAMRGIINKAKAEKRSLTAEEAEQFAGLEARFEEIKKSDAAIQKLESLSRELDEEISERAIETKETPAAKKKSEFRSLGEQFKAIVHAGITHRVDPRLVEYRGDSMMEATPAEGGFLVDNEDMGGILRRAFEMSSLADKCRRLPIGPGKNGLTWLRLKDDTRTTGSRNGGIQVYWLGEGEKLKYVKSQLEEASMKLQKVGAMVRLTDELQEDATALEGYIREFLPEEFAFALDDTIIRGSGVGQPLGLLNSGALVTVAKESGQTAATVNVTNLIKMQAVHHKAPGASPAWFVNKDVKPQLFTLSLVSGSATVPLFTPANGLDGVDRLLGYPVYEVEQCETLGTVGDIILADMSQYWLIEKGDIRVDSSMHVFFDTAEQALRFIKRINGQPNVNKAITPYKAANGVKHSPFVVLATRA